MLKATNLDKTYGKSNVKVLNKASFEIDENQVVSIMGKSGQGKSTIARILCGAISPDSGEVTFLSQNMWDEQKRYNKTFRRQIQLIPQQPFASLDPKQKVGDAICEPLLFHKLVISKDEARTRVEHLLEHVWLDKAMYDRYPSQISGGQAQRIVIARSLTVMPKLLIADESTSMLDISAQAQIIGIFKELVVENNLSILFISHDKALVDAFSDKIYTLENGKLF